MYDLNNISSYLNTNIIGKSIIQFDDLDSTVMKAKNIFARCPDGTVILSENQSKCALSFGNEWICFPDKNIYFSIILKAVYNKHLLPLIDAVACSCICKSIEDLYKLDCKIKWPNDIFINGSKLASASSHISGKGAGIIVSLNINVNMEEKIENFKFTSIKIEKGDDVDREELIGEILNNFEYHYKKLVSEEKASEAVSFYNDNFLLCNKEIGLVKKGRKTVKRVVAKSIDNEGWLVVVDDKGVEEILRPGDTIIQDEES